MSEPATITPLDLPYRPMWFDTEHALEVERIRAAGPGRCAYCHKRLTDALRGRHPECELRGPGPVSRP